MSLAFVFLPCDHHVGQIEVDVTHLADIFLSVLLIALTANIVLHLRTTEQRLKRRIQHESWALVCAQLKARSLNLEAAAKVLSRRYPERKEALDTRCSQLQADIEGRLNSKNCDDQRVFALHRERNLGLAAGWPNWVLRPRR